MPNLAQDSSRRRADRGWVLRYGPWRPSTDRGLFGSRRVRRIVIASVLLILVASVFLALLPPFWHSNAHMFLLTASNGNVLNTPLLYVEEDFEALKPLGRALSAQEGGAGPIRLANLDTRGDLSSLSEILSSERTRIGRRDVLLAYVVAHGIQEQDAGYLLCGQFDPARNPLQRVSIRGLLKLLASSPAAVKLLILDAGRVFSDPRLGIVANEFPRLLQKEVEAIQDPDLWVLCSHSAFQWSHLWHARQRSVFGVYVSRALYGAADQNGDQMVDLAEMFGYVAVNVETTVRRITGGAATQTPILLRGGGGRAVPDGTYPVILSVSSLPRELRSRGLDTQRAASQQANGDAPSGGGSSRTLAYALRRSGIEYRIDQSAPGLGIRRAQSGVRMAQAEADMAGLPSDSGTPTTATDADTDSEPAADDTNASPGQANGGSAADDGQTGDSQPGEEGAAPNGNGAATQDSGAVNLLAQYLTEAWQLRDAVRAREAGVASPVDFAPHLWRRLQEQLLGYDQRLRAGEVTDENTFFDGLWELLLPLRQLAGQAVDPDQIPLRGFDNRIVQLRPRFAEPVENLRSLGLAEMLAAHGGQPLPEPLRVASQRLDELIRNGTREDFDNWLSELNPALDHFAELRLARQLAALPDTQWTTIQLALETRRIGEQVAAFQVGCTPWVRSQVDETDRWRIAGERMLLDQIGSAHEERAVRILREALTARHGYQATGKEIVQVQRAIRLRNDLLERAPYYVQWHEAMGNGRATNSPTAVEMARLLERLEELIELLDEPDREKFSQISDLYTTLINIQLKVESGFGSTQVQSLAQLSNVAGEAWRVNRLLDTPLLSWTGRIQLIVATQPANTASATAVDSQQASRHVVPAIELARDEWHRLFGRLRLQTRLAHLVAFPSSDGVVGKAAVQTRLEEIEQTIENLRDWENSAQEYREIADNLFAEYRKGGAWLREFYTRLPHSVDEAVRAHENLTAKATRPEHLRMLRAAQRALYLVDAHDAPLAVTTDPAGHLRRAALYDLLAWHRWRFLVARADASSAQARYLTDAADTYETRATRIPLQPDLERVPRTRLSLTGPSHLQLATVIDRDMELTLSGGDNTQSVWILLDYDPDLVEVRVPPDLTVYHEHELREQFTQRFRDAPARYPYRPESLSLPATYGQERPDQISLRLNVQRKRSATYPSPLIVKAISGHAYVRHEVPLTLPYRQTIDLLVRGVPGSWTPSTDGVVLHPFPNQRTDYLFHLVNEGLQDQRVDVELFTANLDQSALLPDGALMAEEAATVLERFTPTTSVVRIANMRVPSDGEPVPIPFGMVPNQEGQADNKDEAAPDAEQAPQQEEDTGSSAESAPGGDESSVPATRIDDGMLLTITDRDTKLVTIKVIDVEPQHPRRYVRPQVGYDLQRERIDIRVAPEDPSVVPPGGIKIRLEIPDGLSPLAERKLDGIIKAPDFQDTLYAAIPAKRGLSVRVYLDVDDYPRALIYDVPCDSNSLNVPEATNVAAVRMLVPAESQAHRAPAGPIQVQLQVDAPLGAFQSGDALLDVGFDLDLDREFIDEPTVNLPSDRDTQATLKGYAPNGRLTLETSVRDLQMELTPPSFQNARIGLLARLHANGQVTWSAPRDIILDGSPPSISRIELIPGRVVAPDKVLEVSAIVDDHQMSDVAEVEVGLDVANLGEFGSAPPPVKAVQLPGGRWSAQVPTAGVAVGSYNLLLRAKDKVGNQSDYTRVLVQVANPEDAAKLAAQMNRVLGSVRYGKQGVPNVPVVLETAEGKKIGPVMTDNFGNFTFSEVPPGQVTILAQRLIRNKNRQAQAELEVPAPPARVEPIILNFWPQPVQR